MRLVTNPGTKSNTEGDSVSWSVSKTYSGMGTVVYSATGLPPGLAIDPSTGAITSTVDPYNAVFESVLAGGPFLTTGKGKGKGKGVRLGFLGSTSCEKYNRKK